MSDFPEIPDWAKQPVPFHPQTARFLAYHQANPQVLVALRDAIRTAWQSGVRQCSIATFYELVRWRLTQDAAARAEREGQVFDGRMFSMANAHRAYYARLLENMHPVLAGFFETCQSEADNRTAEWIAEATK